MASEIGYVSTHSNFITDVIGAINVPNNNFGMCRNSRSWILDRLAVMDLSIRRLEANQALYEEQSVNGAMICISP
jgi:hypothetical protein